MENDKPKTFKKIAPGTIVEVTINAVTSNAPPEFDGTKTGDCRFKVGDQWLLGVIIHSGTMNQTLVMIPEECVTKIVKKPGR